VIEIPNSASIKMARRVLGDADWPSDVECAVVRFHPRWCHMQPWILCALGAWAIQTREDGGTVEVRNSESASCAWRFGLHRFLGHEPGRLPEPHEEAGRFVPLKQIRRREELAVLLADIVPLLHLANPEHAKAVQYVISEMVGNVLEHSQASGGAVVAAQLYSGDRARRRYVSIGVADFGIGVRTSLSANFQLSTDTEAVVTAIRPGTTGAIRGLYGAPDNAGAGLFFTHSLARATGAYFALGSGGAMYRSSLAFRQPSEDRLVFPINTYSGTVVCAEIGLDNEIVFNDFLAATGARFSADFSQARDRARQLIQFT
jgi:hypothetical protein